MSAGLPSAPFSIFRSADLLALRIELVDLAIEPGVGGGFALAPTSPNACLIVRFPPQHAQEQAFRSIDPRPFAQARLAGPSRLVFRVRQRMPLSLETLLGWREGGLAPVVPSASAALGDRETVIELPFRMLLAPDAGATWAHRLDPAASSAGNDRWYELWHTQLDAPGPNARVWVAGARLPDAADPIGTVSVRAADRAALARQSRAATGAAGVPDIPVTRLLLSSQGASVDLAGVWSDANADRPAWRHVASFGRDQHVRVAQRGFLHPFGHRASVTTVTERAFGDNGDAHLDQYQIVTVTEREKRYADRAFPMQRVRIETMVTPRVLVDPVAGGPILYDNVPYAFQFTGFDQDNAPVTFSLPLSFVPEGSSHTDFDRQTVLTRSDDAPMGVAQLAGQALAFAPGGTASQASTRLVAHSISFATRVADGDGVASPTFLPVMERAAVSIPAVDQLFGGQRAVEVQMAKTYLHDAFGAANKSQVFLQMADVAQSLPARAQQMGGMLAPELNVAGLSRELGVLSGAGSTAEAALAKLDAGKFSPEDFLGVGTKLFGSVPLTSLLPLADFVPGSVGATDQIDVDRLLGEIESIASTADAAARVRERLESATAFIKVPAMSTRTLLNAAGLPEGAEITYLWKPVVRPDLKKLIETTAKTKIWLLVRVTARAGVEPEFRVEGHVTDFKLPMLDVMTVSFDRVRFRSAPGQALELKPEIGEVTFAGPLAFINSLQDVLSAFGVDVPFDVAVQPTSLRATYSLGIPPFMLGLFGVENLRLTASLKLPFVESAGPIALRFALSERSAPFLVTYSFLAGGGFFSLELDAGGGVAIEAAVEFGGKLGFDVGVAKGGIYAMAGIYFSVKRDGTTSSALIEGYIRAGGFVDVLGIAGVTIEFFVGLRYFINSNSLIGSAKVKACIDVLFFNECVGFDVKYTIAGSGTDAHNAPDAGNRPRLQAANAWDRSGQQSFTDLVSRADWDAYCAAYA